MAESADKYDRALAKYRELEGKSELMSNDERNALKTLSREASSRGNTYRAIRDGNMSY